MLGLGLGLTMRSPAASATVFDPATLPLSLWCKKPYTGSPWTSVASTGASSGRTLSHANAPDAVDGDADFDPAAFDRLLLDTLVMSDVIAGSGYSGWAVVNVDAISTDDGAAPHSNVCIASDQGGSYWCLYLRSSGLVGLQHHDGSRKVVTASISTGARARVQFRFTGTQIQIRVNGGAWQSFNAGAPGDLSFPLGLGRNSGGSAFLDGKMSEFALSNSALTDEEMDDVDSYLAATY